MEISLKKENKKSAIVSLGARVSLDSTNVRSVDLIFLREYLQNVLGRECHFVSKKSKKDYLKHRDFFKDISNTNLNDYDEVWIYNSAFNPFGGIVDLEALQTFEKICDFKGKLFYLLADPKMPCTNYAQFLKSRYDVDGIIRVPIPDGDYYTISSETFEKYTNEIWPSVITAFCGADYDKYLNNYQKNEGKDITSKLCNGDWCKVELFEYYAINEDLNYKLKNYDWSHKKYDLIYFGNNRHTSRGKLIEKLYDNSNFNVYIAGYDPEFKNAKTEIGEYVPHDLLFPTISSSYATVVCGDELHNGNIRTPRFFESMLVDTVAFIHNSFDPEHKYVSNEKLADFIYVETSEDIRERLLKIKNDESLYRKIVEAERNEIVNQFEKYKVAGKNSTLGKSYSHAEALF